MIHINFDWPQTEVVNQFELWLEYTTCLQIKVLQSLRTGSFLDMVIRLPDESAHDSRWFVEGYENSIAICFGIEYVTFCAPLTDRVVAIRIGPRHKVDLFGMPAIRQEMMDFLQVNRKLEAWKKQ